MVRPPQRPQPFSPRCLICGCVKGLWSPLVASAIILASSAGAVGGDGKGPEAVVLHVDIDKDGVVLNQSSSVQMVSLTGSVLVDYVYLVTVRVALSVSTDLGWTASVVPDGMTFVSSIVQFFNATVNVPAGTYNRTAIMTVRGNATVTPGVPGDTASDTATITVSGGQNGGNGTGPPPVVPRGRPASTAVNVPPVPAIIAAATIGAIVFSAFMFWYTSIGPSKKTIWKRPGGGK